MNTDATGRSEAPTFRQRLQKTAAVQRRTEEFTAADQWRFIKAQFGWCRTCRKSFEVGESVAWHVPTKIAMHAGCAARIHPHLNEWIERARRSRWPL